MSSGTAQHKYQRIDKGVKRGRKLDKRTTRPHAINGDFLPACTPEQRKLIMAEALDGLRQGQTTDQVAARHNIDGSTLRRWLLTDDVADFARKQYFDGELAEARQEIRAAQDAFTLARAREDFRAVSWLAERRLPAYYGQHTHMVVEHVGDLGDRLRRARERTIDSTCQTLPSQGSEKDTQATDT